jgi:hypothetical protein
MQVTGGGHCGHITYRLKSIPRQSGSAIARIARN